MTEEQKRVLSEQLSPFYQSLMDKIDKKSQTTANIIEEMINQEPPTEDELKELTQTNKDIIDIYQEEIKRLEEIFKNKENYEFFKNRIDTNKINGEEREIIWYKDDINAQITEAERFVRPLDNIISMTNRKDVFIQETKLDYYNTLVQEMNRLVKENTMLSDYGRTRFTSPKIDDNLDEQTQKALETLWRKERLHVSNGQLLSMLNNSLQNRLTKKSTENLEEEIEKLKELESSYIQQIENINGKFTTKKLEKLQNILYQNWVTLREHNSAILRKKSKMSYSEYNISQKSLQREEMENTTPSLIPVLHSLEKVFYMLKNKEPISNILSAFENLNLNLKQAKENITYEKTIGILNRLEGSLNQYLISELDLLDEKNKLNNLEELLKDNRENSSALFKRLLNLRSRDKYIKRRNQIQKETEAQKEAQKAERRALNEERQRTNEEKQKLAEETPSGEEIKEEECKALVPVPIMSVEKTKNKKRLKDKLKKVIAIIVATATLITGIVGLNIKGKSNTTKTDPTYPSIVYEETLPKEIVDDEKSTKEEYFIDEEKNNEEEQEDIVQKENTIQKSAGLGDVVKISNAIYDDKYSASEQKNKEKPYFDENKEYTTVGVTLSNGENAQTIYITDETGKELESALIAQGYKPVAYAVSRFSPEDVMAIDKENLPNIISGYVNISEVSLVSTTNSLGRGM